jgi:predicted transcriptional regulator
MPAADDPSTNNPGHSPLDKISHLKDYDLSPLELELLSILITDKKSRTLEELIKKVGRDENTVFWCLQKLVGLRICIKETRSINETMTVKEQTHTFTEGLYLYCQANNINFAELRDALNTSVNRNVNILEPGYLPYTYSVSPWAFKIDAFETSLRRLDDRRHK